jgi:hypothetical protein
LKTIFTLNLCRIIALAVWAIGAGISINLTLYAGHANKSVLLVGLFLVWVLSPFAAILVAHARYRLGSGMIRITIYCLMLVISVISLLGYSGRLSPPGARPAGVFLIVPLLLWVLMLIVIPVVLSQSRRKVNQ